jgi:demethylmenaquinone methyltransferase / 2-methoxy-6-polyprenyl-1,4-benzoquinol methylase
MSVDGPTTGLPDPRPGQEKQARLVQAMFDRVAPRYDLANTVLSLGYDRHWRRVTVAAVDPRPGETVLDIASGTGVLAAALAERGARTLAADFSQPMLAAGAGRRDRPLLSWVAADARRLPLGEASVDAVTMAFGLRNLPDAKAGLVELARVTRPGGRLAILEFSQPTWAPFRAAYHRYLTRALPAVARVVTSDPAAYTYLAESIQAWPDQQGLAAIIADAGWERVRYQNLTGGIVALHLAERAA